MNERIFIFDTTLRDGEQSPGASMNEAEKLQMACQLERLGVDVIEAGFPRASEEEFRGVRKVAQTIQHASVCALARTVPGDIERAAEALEPAAHPTLHTFIASSDIHLEHKLRMSRQQVLDSAGESVRLAKSLVERVEFSAEDSTRSDLDFLAQLVSTAIEAGADVINLPDTVGYTTPEEIEHMFRYVREHAAGSGGAVFSCHNHNDLGLAVSNALAAVRGGARQIECTVNGIGERAGNTSLEEVVMAMHTRADRFPYECGIVTAEITNSSRLLSNITGLLVPYNKPIVGRNAFAHESGIHQHGMIANEATYEIMTPASVGRAKSDLILGKHSGRAGLRKRCEELGFTLTDDELTKFYERFIELADKKREVYEDDLRVLLASMREETFEVYQLDKLYTSGSDPAMAMVKLRHGDDEPLIRTAVGDGPVDAACNALEAATGVSGKLDTFNIRAATPGKDALGEAHVNLRIGSHVYYGTGASTDIIRAAVEAYLHAINKHLAVQVTEPLGASAAAK